MIRALDISNSALVAQRTRLDVATANIANADVTHQEDGTKVPYRRRYVTFVSGDDAGNPGVRADAVRLDQSPFMVRYKPGHPDADAAGNVQFPNVNITMEYVDAMAASRAYEANAAMMNVTRGMVQQALRLIA